MLDIICCFPAPQWAENGVETGTKITCRIIRITYMDAIAAFFFKRRIDRDRTGGTRGDMIGCFFSGSLGNFH